VTPTVEAIARIAPLFAVVVIGAAATRWGVFGDIGGGEEPPRTAIRTLNRFALYVAYPALIFSELTSPALEVFAAGRFVGAHAAAFCAMAVVAGAVARRVAAPVAGAITLASLYGNIAYLGIPFCTAAFGGSATGLAALSASTHAALGLAVGPWLLVGAGERGALGAALRRVARLPLVWVPAVALAARVLPDAWVEPLRVVATPLGQAAPPVALFMLGAYLAVEGRSALSERGGGVATAVLKLGVYPATTWAVAAALGVDGLALQVMVVQAAMPTAITTFALASELRSGERVTARAIVLTSIASVATLTLWWVGVAS
jgi:predicted permease